MSLVSFQGKSGAYSEQAIFDFAKKNEIQFESKPCKNFRELFESVENKTKLGMVPIENSNAGSVVECYDLLLEYDFEIIGEIFLEIDHCLLVKDNINSINEIEKVISHPQALAQCEKFLEKNNLNYESYLDTAGSADFVSKNDLKIASISSEFAAQVYGLKVLERNIRNVDDNTTRFLLVKKKGEKFEFENKLKFYGKSKLVFESKDTPGALYKCLGAFATYGLNLTKIESRPNKKEKFSYVFFVDIEDDLESNNAKLALEELNFFSKEVRILGKF